MTYPMKADPKALSYLNSLLNFEQVPSPDLRIWNLKRMRELLEIFDHPEKGVFTILVAGTKGKGSSAYFLSEILRRSGLQVGFYHSPHLESPTERIWINGQQVSERDFACGLLKIQKTLQHNDGGGTAATYFEILTLLATILFREKKVEVAIYEVGMGGRLDATNALPAKLTLLTPIHYDHEAYLGDTLPQIAREKAAILRPGRDVISAPQVPEVMREIQKVARKRKCPLWPPLSYPRMRLRLRGDFQKLNAKVAIRAARILQDRYRFSITDQAIRKGIGSNHWPGRMELFKRKPALLLDGAHNPKSIEALTRNLRRLYPRQRKILIFGTSRDKRTDRMLPLLARVFKTAILTRSQTPRAKEVTSLLAEARHHFPVLVPARSSGEALSVARRMARPNDLIVGTGSFYLIGELRALCQR